ncbi:CIC11C00000001202 [Sungouiella intermedia]|uniref:CIC11C00000001202 n=1 Tax=Sungouiella intermedia TaxID=45354 RepID=A0A1L0G1H3_9ASCO|nr:CIC11C00000001202 [[Candida] intermedia]
MSQTQNDVALPEKSDTLDRKTLFVRSIPLEASNDDLSEYFSQFVPVKHAVIVTDGDKKSRGFGFVSFTMEEDTLTALVEAKKNKFQNRFLRVDIAKRRDRKGKKEEGEEETPKEIAEPVEKRKARLIIRNLPWTCKSPDTLRKVFLKYGAVHDAYIPTKKGGLMKGFAFVTMKKNAAAERAVKESVGLKIDGREVAVDLAVEKSKWEKIQEEEAKEIKSTGRERPTEEDKEGEKKEEVEEEEEENEDMEVDEEKEEDSDSDSDSESDSDTEEFDKLNEIEEEKPKEKQNKQEAFSVFVRNIPYDADKDSLKEHFSLFGPVKYALPVVDKVTGVAKGSAFVAFKTHDGYTDCLANAPTVSSTSMLISDDVAPEYVYQGRILSIVSTVDRQSATKLAERNSAKRKEEFGIDVGEKDKRNLFLLNEGRITENSKLAQYISAADMEIREKSYKLRVQQLNKNPTLHLSLTRLAIRNLPRAMTGKALKALGRKAVVQFATEVKEEKRQPLSKEEISRSIKYKHDNEDPKDEKAEEEKQKKKNKKAGVVKQAKVIMEVKGSGDVGRSRGYGFVEFRDHKAALMALRWLNAHEVTAAEILEGLDEEEKKLAVTEGLNKRKLIVEFAIENAQVVKRRREMVMVARHGKRKREGDEDENEEENDKKKQKKKKGPSRKGNMNKGPKGKVEGEKKEKAPAKSEKPKSGLSDNVKNIIGRKRKMRKGKN